MDTFKNMDFKAENMCKKQTKTLSVAKLEEKKHS